MSDSEIPKSKKQRIPLTTVVAEATVKKARLLAAVQNTTISRLVESAVVAYIEANLAGALEEAGIGLLVDS